MGNLLGGEVVSHGEKEEPCLDDLLSMRGAAFHRWVTAEKEKNALRAYERLRAVKEATLEERVAVSRKLLEVGRASEAVSILNERTQGAEESIELRLLRSAAYAAAGDYVNAIAQCDAALKREPKNLRAKMRMAELQKEATR